MREIEIYAGMCREALREGGASYSKWFFDERNEFPDFAFLRSFEMSSLRHLVHDYLVYFEVHMDSEKKRGLLSVCTLEVGPSLVRSKPSQNNFQISDGSKLLAFRTTDERHHLEGGVVVGRSRDGCVSRFLSAEYSLNLIHPGTKEITKKIKASADLDKMRTEITCPKCLGKGDFYSMSIPEASYKSGLSGYALYSENTICSHTGCSLCGGSGTSYEEWYIKEKGIRTEDLPPLVRGRGRVVIGGHLVT